MEIKHFVLLISIFYLLSSSASTRPPSLISNNNNSPESPDSTPESPDSSSSTPESPDGGSSTPESPDGGLSTPESPDGGSSTPDPPDGDSSSSASPGPSSSSSFTIFPGSTYPGLEKICGATDYPIECVKFIAPHLNDSITIDPITVLKVGLQAADNMTKQAIDRANKLRDDPKTSENIGSSLRVCVENYDLIPDYNQKALEAIANRNMDDLKTHLSADLTNVNTCFDAYQEGSTESPMKEMDSSLRNQLRVNLQIAAEMIKF